ncbi:MAG: hypothetical protein H7345_11815 [Rubritepida sp.]|nr:hypothetical protein [Rubritepida sp.]
MAKAASRRGRGKRLGDMPDSFDRWLDEGLHKLYDDVVNAPLPAALLALIEGQRDSTPPEPVVTPTDEGHPCE